MGLSLHGRLTVVRPATDDDADLLVAWHADPEVSRYWDDEAFTREQVLERLHREPVGAWIVEVDGEPVGYLQSWWEDALPRRGGLDGFLLPAARGRGLMPDAAHALAQSLLDAGWVEVTVDPYTWNERAIRAWRKAGFVEVSRTEKQVLMRFETPEPGSPQANQVRELDGERPESDSAKPNQIRELGGETPEPGSAKPNQVREFHGETRV